MSTRDTMTKLARVLQLLAGLALGYLGPRLVRRAPAPASPAAQHSHAASWSHGEAAEVARPLPIMIGVMTARCAANMKYQTNL